MGGFNYGYLISEHLVGDLVVAGCTVGLVGTTGYHANFLSRVSLAQCQYGIGALASCPLSIGAFDIEWLAAPYTPTWMRKVNDVYDPSNYLIGNAKYISTQANVGLVGQLLEGRRLDVPLHGDGNVNAWQRPRGCITGVGRYAELSIRPAHI
jgi:hypothetical protein